MIYDNPRICLKRSGPTTRPNSLNLEITVTPQALKPEGWKPEMGKWKSLSQNLNQTVAEAT